MKTLSPHCGDNWAERISQALVPTEYLQKHKLMRRGVDPSDNRCKEGSILEKGK